MKNYFFLVLLFLVFSGANCLQAQSKVELINSVKGSVVRIHSFSMPFIQDESSYSTGTGYVADKDGLIITNNHVVHKSIGLMVYSPGVEKPYYASIVWQDSTLDLAVIKAQNCDLQPLQLATPEQVSQGQETLIFGYPPGYKDENLKVSWGIISTDTKDSTLQTTAPINPGNSGGPAVDFEGKVIGTVYAKIVGLNVEGTGFIRNIRYSYDALQYAKAELAKPLHFYGTGSFEAYKLICDAAILGWKAYEAKDVAEKDNINENSKNLILRALDIDPGYGDAYYFLAGYYFNKYLLLCLQNKDNEASTSKEHFIKALEEAENRKPSLGFNDNYLSTLKGEIKKNNLDCKSLRNWIAENQESEEDQQSRLEDFYNYIYTGQTPVLLQKSISKTTTIYEPGIKDTTTPKPDVPPPPPCNNTFTTVCDFDPYSPVRICASFLSELNDIYNKNIGCSIGNFGYPDSHNLIFFKHQFSFDLFQYHFDTTESDDFQRYMIFSYNLGIQVKPFVHSRFNPKPFVTVGINPVNYKIKTAEAGSSSEWNLINGAFNFGLDFDTWLTDYFGISLSWEKVIFIAKIIDTIYDEDDGLPFEYSKFKIGIFF